MRRNDFNPKIINSSIDCTSTCDFYSVIESSTVLKNTNIYKMTRISNSQIGENNSIGDLSRINNSSFGSYVRIDRLNYIYGSLIGSYSYTGQTTVIMNSNIGKFVSISLGVTIGPPNHDYTRITNHSFLYHDYYDKLRNLDKEAYNRFEQPCVIGNDVWIGCNATILRNVSIGDGAVIGANALVNCDVPPYAIVVGIPARVVKYRFEKEVIDLLLKLKWWDWSEEKIKNNFSFFSNKPTKDELLRLFSFQEDDK